MPRTFGQASTTAVHPTINPYLRRVSVDSSSARIISDNPMNPAIHNANISRSTGGPPGADGRYLNCNVPRLNKMMSRIKSGNPSPASPTTATTTAINVTSVRRAPASSATRAGSSAARPCVIANRPYQPSGAIAFFCPSLKFAGPSA